MFLHSVMKCISVSSAADVAVHQRSDNGMSDSPEKKCKKVQSPMGFKSCLLLDITT